MSHLHESRSTPPHTSIAQTEEWVNKMVSDAQNGVTDFVICLKPEMVAIGKCGIWQDTEIGFMLAREYWRKGLAEEALRAVLAYFFEERRLLEVVADVDPRNGSSKALLGKLGFVVYDFKEKTFEIGGEWVDSEYLKLTRERWEEVGRK
ncbi:hypothetical protein LTR84_006725 [Exophiala bonariae]|uniref:N-acetyltransferase domain-containing protein n=1 Tax=Exophiala bonariae TaxID=1690606 RepID=A0AAV9N0B7_9EURO|nr:hypothetical protein LTR84_006725 [Exophiala bonariae]